MRRGLLLLVLLISCHCLVAQELPPEWLQYDTDEYLSDFQSGYNNKSLSEAAFKESLLNTARVNLAKQVQMRIQDVAELDKKSVDGRTHTVYRASTEFSTDVNMTLVETKTKYDPATRAGFAIAYVNKRAALQFYQNDLLVSLGKVDGILPLIEAYVEAGFIDKAKAELKKAELLLDEAEEPFFWLNIFGMSESELSALLDRTNQLEYRVKSLISELQYALRINFTGSVDIFGSADHMVLNEVRGKLSEGGCTFTDDAADSDWVVTVTAEAREYNCMQVGAQSQYYAFLDAYVSIVKVSTSQRVYENEISVKGGHFSCYRGAAQAARKKLSQEIYTIVESVIKQ